MIHERPWSRVLRVPTAQGDLFLKQCAPVQAFEVPLTAALAARWPDRLPGVVAADVERSWLLLRDGGSRLRERSMEPYARTLRLYAELQVGEAARVDELLALGVPDLRLSVLAALFEPFAAGDHGLAAGERLLLRSLVAKLHAVCGQLAAVGLPDSIQHDDLHDGNVFVRRGRPAILDWGDSSVGHPFLSFMRPVDLAASRGADLDALTDAYLGPWRPFAPDARLREALRLAIPVARAGYVLQYQRQLDAMAPGARSTYRRWMATELRRLLHDLAAA